MEINVFHISNFLPCSASPRPWGQVHRFWNKTLFKRKANRFTQIMRKKVSQNLLPFHFYDENDKWPSANFDVFESFQSGYLVVRDFSDLLIFFCLESLNFEKKCFSMFRILVPFFRLKNQNWAKRPPELYPKLPINIKKIG